MAAKSDYLENKIIDWLFRGQAFTPPATLHFALLTTNTDDDGSPLVEVSGGSYARVGVAASLTNFAAAQATASGTLTGIRAALSAAAVSRSSVGASLSTAIRLQASTFGDSSCSADLSTQILVQAAAYSVSLATADLTVSGALPPKIIANELKVTRITGAYKLEQLSTFSVTSGTQRFMLQQQGNFSITNSTPRFQIERV